MPQVSIIVPAYNHEKFISECLDSLIRQTVSDWECIVVNDGSTDGTKKIVLAYIQKDPRIRMIEQHNKGLSAARNAGLCEAKGDYLQFLDSDDAIKTNKLKLQLDSLQRTGSPALSYTDYYYSIENDLTVQSPRAHITAVFASMNYLHDLISNWENKMSIPFHCFLFDASLFKKHNIAFDEQLPNHEDWDCLMNIFRLNPEVFYVDQKLAIYRRHEYAMARDRLSMKNGFIRAIRKHRYSFPENSIEHKLLIKKRKQVLHLYSLYKLYRPVKKHLPFLTYAKVKAELLNRHLHKPK
jgi:hypothetical protein